MRFLLCTGIIGCALAATAAADTPANGIGSLSVSPDGRTVLAAAENRVVYVLDGQDLSVRERIWIKVSPVWIRHVAGGRQVLVRGTQGELIAFDSEGFEELWRVSRTAAVDHARAADQVVFAVRQGRNTIIGVLDAASTETVASFDLGEMRVREVAISPDGGRITVLGVDDKRESEERQNPPAGLADLAREQFAQEHDQRGARIVTIDVASGQITAVDSWYSGKTVRGMAFAGDDTIVLAHGRNVARISPAGEVALIDTGAAFHYGAGLSADGRRIYSGALAQLNIKTLGSTGARAMALTDPLPGWPEYVVSFAEMPDGRLIAGTSAWRVVEISADLGAMRTVPVF
ncbi:MAG: hypothetical protein D6686_12335 [Alphaproteobacteria bacterium]|nr:MAG: hypothetical protein D6686_12335 [Alphaproteobacteria bacterium]